MHPREWPFEAGKWLYSICYKWLYSIVPLAAMLLPRRTSEPAVKRIYVEAVHSISVTYVKSLLAFLPIVEGHMLETFLPNNADRIHLKTKGKIVFVPLKSIYSLESAGNYVEVFIGKQSERFLVRETLSSFEERLDARHFVRIHRSVIVNTGRIREMRPRYTGEYNVTLDNGKELTLSRGYRSNLRRLLEICLTTTPMAS